MIKKASLSEELFVIVLPGGEILKLAEKIQKRISDFYNIYKRGFYPQIHLTLDRIKAGSKEIDKSIKITEEVVEELEEPIKIEVDEFSCYYLSSNDFLVLKVNQTPSLESFARSLHEKLMKANISTIDDYEKWEYHITLISNLFAQNSVPGEKFRELCYIFNGYENNSRGHADKLEIWRPTLDPEKKCVKSYNLKGDTD